MFPKKKMIRVVGLKVVGGTVVAVMVGVYFADTTGQAEDPHDGAFQVTQGSSTATDVGYMSTLMAEVPATIGPGVVGAIKPESTFLTQVNSRSS
jgi:hypothetical protein